MRKQCLHCLRSRAADHSWQVSGRDRHTEARVNQHVAFTHCKFLMHDPLAVDPTRARRTSVPHRQARTRRTWSTVRGDRRVADITSPSSTGYSTTTTSARSRNAPTPTEMLRGLHLIEDHSWLGDVPTRRA